MGPVVKSEVNDLFAGGDIPGTTRIQFLQEPGRFYEIEHTVKLAEIILHTR